MAQLTTKANSLIVAAFVLVFALVGLLYIRYDAEVQSAQFWVQHTYDVIIHVKDLDNAIVDAEAGERGYLLLGNDDLIRPYNASRDRAAILLTELKDLTADNPEQQARLNKLLPLMQERFALHAQRMAVRKSSGVDAALGIVDLNRGREVMGQIRELVAAMSRAEAILLRDRLGTAVEVRTVTIIIIGAGALAALLLISVGGVMLREASRQKLRAEDEVRTAANRLRVAFDSLSQGIAVFDARHLLINWNHCFVDLLKLPGDMVRTGMPYETLAAHLNAAGPFLETPAQIEERRNLVVFERSGPGGLIFELRRTGLPAGGFAVTFSDITAKIRAEEVLRNSQRMQALGELTGGVAHDFNNLLTVIGGNLGLMQTKVPPGSELTRYLASAQRGVDRGATLTRHLLAFGRRQPLEPKPVDLNRLTLEMTAGMLRRTLGERIDIRIVESAGLWPALVDPAQLENAILNLALNARDAMPEGGKLTIETVNTTLDERYAAQNEEVTPGQYVMVAVSDTGDGMTPEVVRRAFEPFFTTKDEGKGSGLGLAMVHGFVKQSKGHVKIYSEPGNGTSVKMYLPRSARAAVEEVRGPAALPQGSASILVVEDDADVRRIAVAQLQDLGYRVFEAGDAEAGLKVVTEMETIDLLLTDVVLPGRLRGREFADLTRRASPKTRILFMSGYTENAIIHDGKLDEGTLLLSKPFRREELAKKVAQALESPPAPANGVKE